MEELTDKQKQVLAYLNKFMAEEGRAPTVREIAAAFGISIGPVQKHLKALIRKGYVRHQPGISRGLSMHSHRPQAAIPVLGRVTAGLPAEPLEDIENYVYVDRSVVQSGEYFALRVKGDSMTGAGIFDGDVLVVRRRSIADDGAIVVAMIDGEATVKYLRRRNGRVWLAAANPAYRDIEAAEITVLGTVVYLARTYGASRSLPSFGTTH